MKPSSDLAGVEENGIGHRNRWPNEKLSMSNATLVARIRTLTERLESGDITFRDFADRLPSHMSALEGMKFAGNSR